MLEPPINNGGPGVYPDSSRSRLLWTGGRSLPWSKWASEIATNLPTPIEEALSKATAELGRLDDGKDLSDSQKKRLDALTKRIRTSWRRKARPTDKATRVQIVRVLPAGTGSSRSGGGAGGGGGGGGGSGHRNAPAGDEARFIEHPDGELAPTVVVARPDDIPECEWLDAKEFDEPSLVARWDEPNNRIEANPSCPIIQESIDYWTDQHPRVDADDIAKAVRRIYGFKLRSAVAHMLTAKRRGMITAEQMKDALEPIALTTCAAGFVIEDIALAGDIGALAGKAKSRASA
jgi:hypothetical protein